jgi:hypothetical protein
MEAASFILNEAVAEFYNKRYSKQQDTSVANWRSKQSLKKPDYNLNLKPTNFKQKFRKFAPK